MAIPQGKRHQTRFLLYVSPPQSDQARARDSVGLSLGSLGVRLCYTTPRLDPTSSQGPWRNSGLSSASVRGPVRLPLARPRQGIHRGTPSRGGGGGGCAASGSERVTSRPFRGMSNGGSQEANPPPWGALGCSGVGNPAPLGRDRTVSSGTRPMSAPTAAPALAAIPLSESFGLWPYSPQPP